MKTSSGHYRKTCQRISNLGDAHELTFSCYRNQSFFRSEITCKYLVAAIEKARIRHDFSLWAYVFMPNHVHLLICPNQPDSPYRFWQDGGGYDRNINNPETILKTVRYIHANPIRKGLVESAEDWYYSSADEWQKPGSSPMRVDFDTWPIP